MGLAALALAACGSSRRPAATTTTTTAPTTTTTRNLKSEDPVAVRLDSVILTDADVQTALGLRAKPGPYPGRAGAPPPPQGPLNLDGVTAVFPSPAYRSGLDSGRASVGANHSYLDTTSGAPVVANVLAIKFESAATGGAFVRFASSLATAFGGARTDAHPEVRVGVTPGTVVRAPPSPSNPSETVVTAALYANGVYFLVSEAGATGAIPDDSVIKLLTAQDAKFQAKKASLGLA
jgi:hypothetical protein